MSQDAAPSRLMKLPLEMRHKVYGFASQRPHPQLILKEYLEKTDPDIGPPEVAAPATQANGDNEQEDNNSSESQEQESEGEAVDEDQASDPEIQEENEDIAMTDVEEEEFDGLDATVDNTSSAAVQAPATALATMPDFPAKAGEDGDELDEGDAEENEDEADGDENEEGEDDSEGEQENDDDSEGEEENDDEENDGTITSAPPPVRRREYTGRNTKYRHMLTTIKTRGCPPPVGLLQVNKQIHDEAMEYHYCTSFIEIDVTAAFAHQSFFEETLEKFMSNAFSPMEQVRKVKIIITWDSEWLREKITPPDAELEDDWAFGLYLNERIAKTLAMLSAAPELRHVEVDWHDTEQTDKSQLRMNDTLMEFLSLGSKEWTDNTTEPPTQTNVDVTFREHISEAGTAHARNSLLAKRRAEFDQILASGLAFR